MNQTSHWQRLVFQVKLDSAHIWFEVELPRLYPSGGVRPMVSVKGDIARDEQERWQGIVRDKLQELDDNDC